MKDGTLARRAVAEGLGTAFLLAAIVGSGIMAERLAGGNGALALLCNAIATGAILTSLILIFGPLSGAHFNPVVTLAFTIRGDLNRQTLLAYATSQFVGAIVGVWLAHLMFELPVLQVSSQERWGSGLWIAECIATFGLVLSILGCLVRTPSAIPVAVGLYITSAYWFTASTSFANPAVTAARSLSNTFAGIAPDGVPAFLAAQLVGTVVAVVLVPWMWRSDSQD